jgi:flagellar basal-body rod modification protein FlgD
MSADALNAINGGSGLFGEGLSSSTESQEGLGKSEFLTLLLTQLKNQDPLNPLESTEFTAQLAQFNSLEQLFSVNENLSDIQEMLYSQERENLLGLIGKTIKADDNTILIKDGDILPGSYSLEEAAEVSIAIYDSNGFEVRTLSPGTLDAGEYDLSWDGRDESGQIVEDGLYTFEVTARDEAGNYVTAHTYFTGEVTGVTYEYYTPYLMIGEKLVSADNTIIEVSNPAQGDTDTVTDEAETGVVP